MPISSLVHPRELRRLFADSRMRKCRVFMSVLQVVPGKAFRM